MTSRAHFDNIGRTVTLAAAKRSCLDKKRYTSANRARDAAARIRKRLGHDQHSYRCTLCGGWHLATDRPERKAA